MSSQVKSPQSFEAKINGETRYVQDLELPGQLFGGILRSPYAHARILRIDTSKAKQIAGVRAVLTAEDVPNLEYGPTKYKDWNILAKDKVIFIGDEVAAVAADNKEALQKALAAIVVEYEELPAVFDPEQSLVDHAPKVHEKIANNRPMLLQLQHGDVESMKSKAYIIRGGRYTTGRIYQGHLEPVGVLANWSDEEGLTIWAASHIPYRARETYAAGLGLPEEKVRIIVPPIGGSFGAKYVLKIHIIAAVLARESKRPVQVILDRYEDMITAHPRVPLTIDIQIGADAEGKFLFKDVVVYGDAGARIYWSPNVLGSACSRPDSIYHFQNVRAQGHLCYTNNSPTTCMRGFGNAEMLFAVESVIDEIANGLSLDPTEIRLRNIVKEGETTIHGYRLDTCRLEDCIQRVKELSNWGRRKDLPKYRGLGIGLGNHVSGYRAIDPRYEGSTAVMRLSATGELEVETGEIDIGQGMSVTYAKIAAEALGIEEKSIIVKSGDTGKYPYGIGTLASRSTVMGGNAILLAAEELKKAITNLVRHKLGSSARYQNGEVYYEDKTYTLKDVADWYRFANAGDQLTVRASYVPDTDMPNADFYGNPSPNYPYAAHVAEVEVDPDTGKTKLVGYWAVHDSGKIISKTTASSQVVGAVAQGIGWVTMEDLIVEDGMVRNPSMMDYRMPGAKDMPPVHVEFVEVHDPNGPLGAKSVGEVALDPVPGTIANAIAHALGDRGHHLPLSAERVWKIINKIDS